MNKNNEKALRNSNFSRKLDVYLVIGNSNMGKSSVLRHIGGFPKGYGKDSHKFQVKKLRFDDGTDHDVGLFGYCSLQEMEINPERFIDIVKSSKNCPDRIFVPLQEIPSNSKMDMADVYIRKLKEQGWRIVASVLLNADLRNHMRVCRQYPRCKYVYSTSSGNPAHPTNVVAADVRKVFHLV